MLYRLHKICDKVRHEPLTECQKGIHLDDKDIKVINNLCWNQTIQSLLILKEESDKDICWPLSYLIRVQRETLKDISEMRGLVINEVIPGNLRYSDDTLLMTHC